MRHASWLILAVACGWSEERFEEVGIARLCETAAACAGTYDAGTCVDLLRTTDRSGCAYDKAMARECAETVEDAPCVQVEPFELYELEIPEACVAVYDCEWIDLSAF